MEYLRLSWDDIQRQCETIAKDIKDKGYSKYLIVGIVRGGLMPARILLDMLDNDELYTITVQFYESVGKTGNKPKIVHPVQGDISGKNMLLVDDISDTGESLIVVKQHLEEKGAKKVIVATLMKKPHTKFEPDICADETSAWVIFPWEIRETIRDIKKSSKSVGEFEKEMEKAGISKEEYNEFI
ncbi:MAG: phosphoribosyltransferase [Candidatus Hydrothermarchaeales archaeon]